MKFHPEEYEGAKRYWEKKRFVGLSDEERRVIVEKGKDLMKFHRRHPVAHNLINLFAFLVLFAADWWALLRLPSFIASPIVCGIVVGVLHSYIMYSLVIYTMHEGAAHKLIVLGNGVVSNFFSLIANNLGRIALAESDYYAREHLLHHAHFTTPKDGEFLNFVFPKRLYKSFIPYASIFNFCDFKTHTGMVFTPSRIFSIALFIVYHAVFVFFMARSYSWAMIIISIIVIAPNLAFWLDRLRQFTEHNLMPLDVVNGARDLGLGFWGMLIGGGPWGQPCHWTHHLVPGVPWYNQLRLHSFVKKAIAPEKRSTFFLKPVVGFPRLIFHILRSM